jgi:sugar (pentulose or hexulose) kinase
VWPSVDAACDAVVRVASRVVPDAQAAATLDVRYEAFQRLYGALKDVTAERAREDSNL